MFDRVFALNVSAATFKSRNPEREVGNLIRRNLNRSINVNGFSTYDERMQRVRGARDYIAWKATQQEEILRKDPARTDMVERNRRAQRTLQIIDEEIAKTEQRERDKTGRTNFAGEISYLAFHAKDPIREVRRRTESLLRARFGHEEKLRQVRDAQTMLETQRAQASGRRDTAREGLARGAIAAIDEVLREDAARAKTRGEQFRASAPVLGAKDQQVFSRLRNMKDPAKARLFSDAEITHLETAIGKRRGLWMGETWYKPSIGDANRLTPEERAALRKARELLSADDRAEDRKKTAAEKTRLAAEHAKRKELARIVNGADQLARDELVALAKAQQAGTISEADIERFFALRGGWGSLKGVLTPQAQRRIPVLNNPSDRAFLSRIAAVLDAGVWRPERDRKKAEKERGKAERKKEHEARKRGGEPEVIETPLTVAEGRTELTLSERMGITRLAATPEYRGRVRQEHLDLFFTMWDRTGPDRGKPLNPDEEAAVKIINPMLRRVWGG